jgi:predicted nuclease of predicted toxin-antitoxin system
VTILIDVNLSPDWVNFLEAAGYKAIHWSTIGDCDTPDSEIMSYALQFHCVVLTQDLDFGTILSTTSASQPSVILIRAGRVNPSRPGVQVLSAVAELAGLEAQGAVITIDHRRTRMTLLPLGKRG